MKAAAKGWKDAEMKCLGDQKRQEDAGKKKKCRSARDVACAFQLFHTL